MNEPLHCAFGTPWDEHEPFIPPLLSCAGCRDECERLGAAFDAAVAAGTFDAQGYTSTERREQRRKAMA